MQSQWLMKSQQSKAQSTTKQCSNVMGLNQNEIYNKDSNFGPANLDQSLMQSGWPKSQLMTPEPKCDETCHKKGLLQRLNNKWLCKDHKPIIRVMQIIGFYWKQSLMRRSQNKYKLAHKAHEPIKMITQIFGFH